MNLQVGQIHGRIGLFCIKVGYQSGIPELPPEDVVNDQNGGRLRIAHDIGFVAGELGLKANRISSQTGSGLATFGVHAGL